MGPFLSHLWIFHFSLWPKLISSTGSKNTSTTTGGLPWFSPGPRRHKEAPKCSWQRARPDSSFFGRSIRYPVSPALHQENHGDGVPSLYKNMSLCPMTAWRLAPRREPLVHRYFEHLQNTKTTLSQAIISCLYRGHILHYIKCHILSNILLWINTHHSNNHDNSTYRDQIRLAFK